LHENTGRRSSVANLISNPFDDARHQNAAESEAFHEPLVALDYVTFWAIKRLDHDFTHGDDNLAATAYAIMAELHHYLLDTLEENKQERETIRERIRRYCS
jgi:hypothetical protein